MRFRPSALAVLPFATACTVTTTSGGATSPRRDYVAEARGHLALMADSVGQRGYRYQTADPEVGNLRAGAHDVQHVNVKPGTRYVLLGACDNSCRDLDLRLFDANGQPLLQDRPREARPVLAFTPRTAGRYRLEVRMVSCSRNPCAYAFQLLEAR